MVKREGSKVYIEGVRKISWNSGEMCEFASALISALHTLGEDVPYDFVLGITGAAFRFTLTEDEWDYSDYSFRNISSDPFEPVRRVFHGLGYSYRICEKSTWEEDAASIMNSIDRGVPVLAYPVVGPADCCVVTGYDDGGKVLLGWSTFQDIPDDHTEPHDVTGYFRKTGWHDRFFACILLGEKGVVPTRQEIFLDALGWAACLMRTPMMGKRYTGLTGLKVWADIMSNEALFPSGDPEKISQFYLGTSIWITMLRDHCQAESFLRQAAEVIPEGGPELSTAADCYREVNRIRLGMDKLISDNFSKEALTAITDPSARLAFAQGILQIHDKENEAITHIERLIGRRARLGDAGN